MGRVDAPSSAREAAAMLLAAVLLLAADAPTFAQEAGSAWSACALDAAAKLTRGSATPEVIADAALVKCEEARLTFEEAAAAAHLEQGQSRMRARAAALVLSEEVQDEIRLATIRMVRAARRTP